MNVVEMLKREEGCRLTAYPDPLTGANPWTIGYGHTGPEVVQGLEWTEDQADAALVCDVNAATGECAQTFPWWDKLNEARQAVLIGMVFQMGLRGTLAFRHMLEAVRDQRWHDAFGQMLDSAWAKQTPKRAMRMAMQLDSGDWQ